jgi:hypothetical protein
MLQSCELCDVFTCVGLIDCIVLLGRSFYSSDRFADIPFPPSEDWEAATGKVREIRFHNANGKICD